MNPTHTCPICSETFDERTRITVHLEVEHRKSELVTHLVDRDTRSADPIVEREKRQGDRPDDRPAPSP